MAEHINSKQWKKDHDGNLLDVKYLAHRYSDRCYIILLHNKITDGFIEAYFPPGLHPVEYDYAEPYKFTEVDEETINLYIERRSVEKHKSCL